MDRLATLEAAVAALDRRLATLEAAAQDRPAEPPPAAFDIDDAPDIIDFITARRKALEEKKAAPPPT